MGPNCIGSTFGYGAPLLDDPLRYEEWPATERGFRDVLLFSYEFFDGDHTHSSLFCVVKYEGVGQESLGKEKT